MPSKVNKDLRAVAFLRGINVGGHALIKMDALKPVFENMGLQDVRTVLASGNVIFESEYADTKALAAEIEARLKATFKTDIKVVLRDWDELEKLRSADPFKGIQLTPDTRLYVTFLSGKAKKPAPAIPYVSPLGDIRILRATATEVFSVVDLAKGKGTPEAMTVLEKEFGSDLTTRNWNTVLKILAMS